MYYLTGNAGTGKSEVLINESIRLAQNHTKVCYSLPGLETCEEVFNRITAKTKSVKVTIINSKNTQSGVVSSILKHLSDGDLDEGEILIISHTALQNVPFWHNRSRWTIFFDEAIDVTRHHEINLKKNQNFITDFCSIKNPLDRYSLLEIIHDGLLDRIRNPFDDKFFNIMKEFYQDLLNTFEGKSVCWSHNAYNNNFFNAEGKKFVMTTIYTPTFLAGFERVVVAGAGFEESLMYHCWKKMFGIKWIEDYELKSRLRSVESKGNVIFNVMSERAWTKNLKGKTLGDQSVSDFFLDTITEHVSTHEHVLLLKNQCDKTSFSNVIECPHYNMGMNKFDQLTALVYSGAFNKPPAFYYLMEHFGLEYEAKNCLTAEHLYQTILRTAYRRPDFDGTCNLYLPSLDSATPILNRFQNKEIRFLGNFDEKYKDVLSTGKNGRPLGKKKPNSVASNQSFEKLKAFFYRQKQKCKSEPSIVNNETEIRLTTYRKPTFVSEDVYQYPTEGKDFPLTATEFFKYLTHASKNNPKSKYDTMMMSLAGFYEDSESQRKREDIEYVWGQFIDADTSESSRPLDCAMLQSVLGNVACAGWTTYSGGNRRRLVYLFDKPVSQDDAAKIYNQVCNRILSAYPNCGLDSCSRKTEQLYFFPCQTKDGQSSIEVLDGSLLDTNTFLALNCGWGLTEEQIQQQSRNQESQSDRLKVIESNQVSTKPESEGLRDSTNLYFVRVIQPLLDLMTDGNRFEIGKRIIGLSKNGCREDKARIFQIMESKGVSKSHLKDFERLWVL